LFSILNFFLQFSKFKVSLKFGDIFKLQKKNHLAKKCFITLNFTMTSCIWLEEEQ
jgi:hypothetical protein